MGGLTKPSNDIIVHINTKILLKEGEDEGRGAEATNASAGTKTRITNSKGDTRGDGRAEWEAC